MPSKRPLAKRFHNFRLRWGGRLSGERASYPVPPCPIAIFTHHKTGTNLLTNVFGDLCTWFGWTGACFLEEQFNWPDNRNFASFLHSQIDANRIPKSFRGVHVVRNPVTVLLSGYHYHLRTNEKWCINEIFSETPPIDYPQIPPNRAHFSEAWKIDYLRGLNGLSYQANLRRLNLADGMAFELERQTRFTLEGMRDWKPDPVRVKEMQLEQFSQGFDTAFSDVFRHLEFPPVVMSRALKLARRHDLSRASKNKLARHSHYTGADAPERRKNLTAQHLARIEEIAPGLSQKLGYS